jgi:hypothetical protein
MKIVVLAFCARDKYQCARLLSWLIQLGISRDSWGKEHHLILAHSRNTDLRGLEATSRLAFGEVTEFIPQDENESGWWVSCNHLWWRTVEEMERLKSPFLWLEPDVVPLRPDFLDVLWREYQAMPPTSILAKKLSFKLIDSGEPTFGQVYQSDEGWKRVFPAQLVAAPREFQVLSGIGIYPAETRAILENIDIAGPPFNAVCSQRLASRCHHTSAILEAKPSRPIIRLTFEDVRHFPEDACLFHPCKDGTVIRLLTYLQLGLTKEPDDPNKNLTWSDGLAAIARSRRRRLPVNL